MDLTYLTQAVALSGLAVTLVTEILKSKYIPVPAQKYKRFTALVLSIGASGYVTYQYGQQTFVTVTWQTWGILAFLTLLVSAITYNQIVKTSQKGDLMDITSILLIALVVVVIVVVAKRI